MRNEIDIRRALALLGVALIDPELTRQVWGSYEGARERAWFCFATLGWTLGADDSAFAGVLAHVEAKLHACQEKNQCLAKTNTL